MKRSLVWKALIIGALALLLVIPLAMIEGQIRDRSRRQAEVAQDVAVGRQQVVGPLLVLTYQEEVVREEETTTSSGLVKRILALESRQKIIVPRELVIEGQAQVDERHRGVFKVQAYDLAAQVRGTFELPKGLGLPEGRFAKIHGGKAALVLGISELRGIKQKPVLDWNGRNLEFAPGAVGGILGHALHVDLGNMADLDGKAIPFSFPLDLKGSQDLSFAPVAETTRVSLTSPWSTPSFQGKFFATHREGPEGFEATWEVVHLARSLDAILNGKPTTAESFGVAFLEPVNIYLRSERAVKYGFLFVGLTFAAFFLFEMLKRLAIHPIQYLLVGLALAFFFLLLISLSERIPFLAAYGVASTSCLGLLGVYLSHALRSPGRGWGFAGALAGMYGALYALLVSEDNALLMGTLMLFLALAALMIGTRKIDWYALTEDPKDGAAPGTP